MMNEIAKNIIIEKFRFLVSQCTSLTKKQIAEGLGFHYCYMSYLNSETGRLGPGVLEKMQKVINSGESIYAYIKKNRAESTEIQKKEPIKKPDISPELVKTIDIPIPKNVTEINIRLIIEHKT